MLGFLLFVIMCKKQKGHKTQTCMGIQWHQLNHKDLLEVVTTWQKPCCYCLQSKKDIKLTHAWELNGISSITKTY
jgi:thioredoxin-related protein